MWVCYLLVNNFGLAIIIFTFLVKTAMLPLTLKQQRNMAVSQLFTPRVKEIQTKYRSNPQKQQEEMAKLQKEGYNPMGGCAPMIITMLLLFGVIDVVYRPMTHMEHMGDATTIVETRAKEAETALLILSSPEDKAVIDTFLENDRAATYLQVVIEGETKTGKIVLGEDFKATTVDTLTAEQRYTYGHFTDDEIAVMTNKDLSKLSDSVITGLNTLQTRYKQLQRELFAINVYTEYDTAFENYSKDVTTISTDIFSKLDNLSGNMEFLGINLGQTPQLKWDILVLVPIMSFLFSLAQMIIQQIISKRTSPDTANMGGGMKAILFIMPFFSLYIAFVVPAGVGFYWAVSYLFGIAQSIFIYKAFPPDKMREQAKAKFAEKSDKLAATAVVVDIDESGNEVERVEKLSNLSQKDQKEYYRKKLEAARREDAEKYGEEYIESDDDK